MIITPPPWNTVDDVWLGYIRIELQCDLMQCSPLLDDCHSYFYIILVCPLLVLPKNKTSAVATSEIMPHVSDPTNHFMVK